VIKQTEHKLQAQVKQFLLYCLPFDVAWTSVDHAAAMSLRRGAERKAQGVKAGQADIRFVLPPHGRSAEIELKTATGRVSPAQRDWERAVTNAGGLYAVCRSVDEVAFVLRGWGVQLRAHPFGRHENV
jgi:hypothetical protein